MEGRELTEGPGLAEGCRLAGSRELLEGHELAGSRELSEGRKLSEIVDWGRPKGRILLEGGGNSR